MGTGNGTPGVAFKLNVIELQVEGSGLAIPVTLLPLHGLG
jgi:hypothetical protein